MPQSKSSCANVLQEKVAGAMQYVSESLTPSSDSTQGGAENDPEVKEFRKSAAEAVDGAQEHSRNHCTTR